MAAGKLAPQRRSAPQGRRSSSSAPHCAAQRAARQTAANANAQRIRQLHQRYLDAEAIWRASQARADAMRNYAHQTAAGGHTTQILIPGNPDPPIYQRDLLAKQAYEQARGR